MFVIVTIEEDRKYMENEKIVVEVHVFYKGNRLDALKEPGIYVEWTDVFLDDDHSDLIGHANRMGEGLYSLEIPVEEDYVRNGGGEITLRANVPYEETSDGYLNMTERMEIEIEFDPIIEPYEVQLEVDYSDYPFLPGEAVPFTVYSIEGGELVIPNELDVELTFEDFSGKMRDWDWDMSELEMEKDGVFKGEWTVDDIIIESTQVTITASASDNYDATDVERFNVDFYSVWLHTLEQNDRRLEFEIGVCDMEGDVVVDAEVDLNYQYHINSTSHGKDNFKKYTQENGFTYPITVNFDDGDQNFYVYLSGTVEADYLFSGRTKPVEVTQKFANRVRITRTMDVEEDEEPDAWGIDYLDVSNEDLVHPGAAVSRDFEIFNDGEEWTEEAADGENVPYENYYYIFDREEVYDHGKADIHDNEFSVAFGSPTDNRVLTGAFESSVSTRNSEILEKNHLVESQHPYENGTNQTWDITITDATQIRAHLQWYDIPYSTGMNYQDIEKTHIIETEHPYENDTEQVWYIEEEGAQRIRVHFEVIDTEYDYDEVNVGRLWNTDTFSGSYEPFWTDWFYYDNISVEFNSDGSENGWGFRIDKIEYSVPDGDDGDKLLIFNSSGGEIDNIRGNDTGEWTAWSYGDTISVRLLSNGSVSGQGFKIDKVEYRKRITRYDQDNELLHVIDRGALEDYQNTDIKVSATFGVGYVNKVEVEVTDTTTEEEKEELDMDAFWGVGDVNDPDDISQEWIGLGGPGQHVVLNRGYEEEKWTGYFLIPSFFETGEDLTLFAGSSESFGNQNMISAGTVNERSTESIEEKEKLADDSYLLIFGSLCLILVIIALLILIVIALKASASKKKKGKKGGKKKGKKGKKKDSGWEE